MEKHCTQIYFTLRENRPYADGKCPIQASINANGERIYFSTGKKCLPSQWSKTRQLLKSKDEESLLINDFLITLRNKILKKEIELTNHGYLVTPTLLKEAAFDKVEAIKEKTLLEIISDHNKLKKALVGKSVAKDTYYSFELSERYIKEFILTHYKREDFQLKEIKIEFIQNFHAFMLNDKKNAQNTCVKHLIFLKSMISQAVNNGYIQYNALSSYKITRDPVEIDFLDDAELRKFINFDSPIPRLMRARDAFLFGCFTGLAYIDIKTLTKEHFEKDSEGRIWIKKKRVKTGILSRIPLLPMAKLLLDKYKDFKKGVVFPIQDCTDVNECLKDIAILLGINKHITFHTSRHTFASTVTLANNISMEVIAKMMGHTNTRMTSRYAKLVDKCISDQMDALMNTYDTEEAI